MTKRIILTSIEKVYAQKNCKNFTLLNQPYKRLAEEIVRNFLLLSPQEKIAKFVQNIHSSKNTETSTVIFWVEEKTRGQSTNYLSFESRKGRLTASNHHAIFTKVNTIVRSHSKIKHSLTLLTRLLKKDAASSECNEPDVKVTPQMTVDEIIRKSCDYKSVTVLGHVNCQPLLSNKV